MPDVFNEIQKYRKNPFGSTKGRNFNGGDGRRGEIF